MKKKDYQWPSEKFFPKTYARKVSSKSRLELKRHLEIYFSKLWNTDAILLSSARTALTLIFREEKMQRGHVIFGAPWSSECVWNAISPFSTPSSIFTGREAAAIAVHKFGYITKTDGDFSGLLIEDSCDSLITSQSALFPNSGKFEIFSLPKIMGTYAGGIILSRDPSFTKIFRHVTDQFTNFNEFVCRSRWQSIATKATGHHLHWDALEHKNFSPDYTMLKNIEENLPALTKNQTTLLNRWERIREKSLAFGLEENNNVLATRMHSGRLPLLYLLPPEKIPEKKRSLFMVRNVNIRGTMRQPEFAPHALIPMHFGVSEKRFNYLMNALGS